MSSVNTIYISSGSLVDIDATLFIQLGVFLIMIILLRKLLFAPVIRLVEARYEATDGALSAAKELEEEAGRLNDHVEEELKKVETAATADREAMVEEACVKEREVLRKARDDAHTMLVKMRKKAEEEAASARAALEIEIDSLAAMVVRKVLGREL